MRLILRLGPDELYGSDDGAGHVLGHQHRPLPACQTGSRVLPERLRLGACHGKHEAHRRAALHAVDEYIAQLFDLTIAHGFEASNADTVRVLHQCAARGFAEATTTIYRAGLRLRFWNAIGSSNCMARQSSSERRCVRPPTVTSMQPLRTQTCW